MIDFHSCCIILKHVKFFRTLEWKQHVNALTVKGVIQAAYKNALMQNTSVTDSTRDYTFKLYSVCMRIFD